MNVEILARIQFAFTVAFHYIYPPLSIGIGLILVIMESLYLKTNKKEYEVLTRFWIKIFAITFGIGVATGIIMEFEFGTNWATYSRYVGDIFGSALAAEGLFAFGLESAFLGVLLFGWHRVKPWVHLVATVGVFLGSMFSAVWIVVANSWQQTPAGYHIVGQGIHARAEVTDFWAMVFNPSSVDRLVHTWQGSFLAGAFLVLSVHAYYLRKNKFVAISKTAFSIALPVATFFSLLQLVSGHSSADGVAVNQPAKLAAMEGHYQPNAPADLYLVGWVNQDKQQVAGLKIPGGLSFLVHQDFQKPIVGLRHFAESDRPKQVNAIFQFYHIMIAIGMLLIGLTLYASFLFIKGQLFNHKQLLWVFSFSVLLPQIANQVGWFTAEMGRQPWVVYGLLRTSKAFSQEVSAHQIVFSLVLFTLVYFVLFLLFIYMLNKKIKHGPDHENIELAYN
ncbi:cytochrome ubiquinol oxidase subunit I [Flavobacterium branchiophilum NBRC 15030 = ATCC 35035]|uniref:Cytochrome bd-I ubiquinol oxidase subunit 1 apoprotein n=1 Tax=Flavobacterium branchiophilum TaxID=55197 RepID=A0A543G6D0_9FLAO|nr:cytochrome ubiquinol oxidase subunit I [Flavobacterium branchiophilum]OXA66808.1 cytochrome ubiquinol oxidase subunit I [Flavobacterium branchiophilum NBRC 15030 = ATCC 35035]TQM41648.1 cytochrome bd-I ubiquinol oxidase subunit 1 apoprotein [Flavobacterium branchiophilum]GEM56580.1 cytochrome ubiquinol oxidase subunit I [Flavobacterium branchiophilum NBRC 15030 = ATCC 35035]